MYSAVTLHQFIMCSILFHVKFRELDVVLDEYGEVRGPFQQCLIFPETPHSENVTIKGHCLQR